MWGLVAAAALSIISLPGLSFAQRSVETRVRTPEAAAIQAERDVTTARLELIESELKRLSLLIEDAKRSAVDTTKPRETATHEKLARMWRNLKAVDKQSSVIWFAGTRHKYLLTHDEKAYLSAFSTDGRMVWNCELQFLNRPSGEWSLTESFDHKQLRAIWSDNRAAMTFCLDGDTGRLISITHGDVTQNGKPPAPSATRSYRVLGRSPSVADKLRDLNPAGSDHRKMIEWFKTLDSDDRALTMSIFRGILKRNATDDELQHTMKLLSAARNRSAAIEDIAWVLLNSREAQTQEPLPERR
jgi:hypothetical protein